MQPLACLNGELMPLADAKVSALDRGFLFGDGVYEVVRVYAGRLWLGDEHFLRLARSLDEIRIVGVDIARLRQRLLTTIAAGPFREAVAYLQVTRGAAPRSHAFPDKAVPTEFLYVQEFNDPYEPQRRDGVAVIIHPDLRWARCDVKSLNLLGNVLANQAAKEAGCAEALLYRTDGTVTEGSHSTLFGVANGRLVTTPLGPPILPGVTRRLVLGLASLAGALVDERSLRLEELERVSELFLTGTLSEVLPVVRVDGRPIGDGKPGPLTRKIQGAYREAVRRWLTA